MSIFKKLCGSRVGSWRWLIAEITQLFGEKCDPAYFYHAGCSFHVPTTYSTADSSYGFHKMFPFRLNGREQFWRAAVLAGAGNDIS